MLIAVSLLFLKIDELQIEKCIYKEIYTQMHVHAHAHNYVKAYKYFHDNEPLWSLDNL